MGITGADIEVLLMSMLANAAIIGGLVWYKLHRIRLNTDRQLREHLADPLPLMMKLEVQMKEQLATIESILRGNTIRLDDMEARLDTIAGKLAVGK